MTPFDPETLLHAPEMAILSTVAADGAPRNAPVWYLWEDGALWMPGSTGNSTMGRLARDPRCSAEIVKFDVEAGILLHLGLRGRAEVVPEDAALFRRMLVKYLGPEDGWNPWFIQEIARIGDPKGRLIRLKPDSTFTNNVSFFRSGPDLAWPIT